MDSAGILNPPNPVFLTRSISQMLEEDKQHCEDADEAGFCDLMFPMKRGMHLLEQEAQTNHQQQNYRLRLQQHHLPVYCHGDKALSVLCISKWFINL